MNIWSAQELVKWDKGLYEAMNYVPWLQDRKLAGHQCLDAKRVTKRVLE